MKTYITLDTTCECYSIECVRHTLSVRELIDRLEELADWYGDSTPVVFNNDNGYTYGAIYYNAVDIKKTEDIYDAS